MDISNLRQGEKILGIAGIVLIISMFLAWWSIDLGEFGGLAGQFGIETPNSSFNAFQASNFNDIIWFITGAVAIAVAVIAGTRTAVNSPVALSAVAAVLGVVSLLLIVIRLIDPPGGLDRSYGVFIGLIAIIGIVYGAWLTMQDEGTSIGEQAGNLQDRFGGGNGGQGGPPPPPAAPSASENLGDTFPTTPPPPPQDPSA